MGTAFDFAERSALTTIRMAIGFVVGAWLAFVIAFILAASMLQTHYAIAHLLGGPKGIYPRDAPYIYLAILAPFVGAALGTREGWYGFCRLRHWPERPLVRFAMAWSAIVLIIFHLTMLDVLTTTRTMAILGLVWLLPIALSFAVVQICRWGRHARA